MGAPTEVMRVVPSRLHNGLMFMPSEEIASQVNLPTRGGKVVRPKKILDWSSMTAVNKTAIAIRGAIRKSPKLMFYPQAMRIMLQARNNLKRIKRQPGDKRLRQMNIEIKRTKRTFLPKFLDVHPKYKTLYAPIR